MSHGACGMASSWKGEKNGPKMMSMLPYRGVALPAVTVKRQKHVRPLGKVQMVRDQHHGVRPQQVQDLKT